MTFVKSIVARRLPQAYARFAVFGRDSKGSSASSVQLLAGFGLPGSILDLFADFTDMVGMITVLDPSRVGLGPDDVEKSLDHVAGVRQSGWAYRSLGLRPCHGIARCARQPLSPEGALTEDS